MNARRTLVIVALWLLGQVASASAATTYRIATGPDRSTYRSVGEDLAAHVAPASDLELAVVATAGSVDNLKRLRSERGVRLALVQGDVFASYVTLAASGNRAAADLIKQARVVAPLFDEEVHFVVRADAPWTYVHEIRDATINAGELGSGSALTVTNLYRLLFGTSMPTARTRHLPLDEALVKLVTDRSVDVVAFVSGQPTPLLADVKPEAREHVKLLKLDPGHPGTKAARTAYAPATLRARSYPQVLSEDIPTLATKAHLVTFDFGRNDTTSTMRRFAKALCGNLDVLRAKGHAKWREVDLAVPTLPRGWSYLPAVSRELRECGPDPVAKPAGAAGVPDGCANESRVLGLCGKR